jgi:hypothetical protein
MLKSKCSQEAARTGRGKMITCEPLATFLNSNLLEADGCVLKVAPGGEGASVRIMFGKEHGCIWCFQLMIPAPVSRLQTQMVVPALIPLVPRPEFVEAGACRDEPVVFIVETAGCDLTLRDVGRDFTLYELVYCLPKLEQVPSGDRTPSHTG